MAIAARVSPSVIVTGVVVRERIIEKKSTGEVLGANYVIETDGGPLYVTAWERALTGQIAPEVHDTVTIWVSVDEGERGSQLSYVRPVTPEDLDKLVNFQVLTGK